MCDLNYTAGVGVGWGVGEVRDLSEGLTHAEWFILHPLAPPGTPMGPLSHCSVCSKKHNGQPL